MGNKKIQINGIRLRIVFTQPLAEFHALLMPQ